jgi:2-dehydro-3-deoxygalactonokinase
MSRPDVLKTAPTAAALIGIDWGTSSMRAWRIGPDGTALETRRSQAGVLAASEAGFPAAFDAATGDWRRAEPEAPVLLSGMIGSRQGWVEAPYAPAPAGLPELARALAPVESHGRLLARIAPGVSLTDGPRREVMRGEETQIVGAASHGRRLAVLPGTHSKWAQVEDASILDFSTFLTGELYAALLGGTILGRGLSEPDAHDEDAVDAAFAEGVREARGRGLLGSLFQTRARTLLGGLTPRTARAFLSGLVIGAEIAEGLARFGRPEQPLLLIGAPSLLERYRAAFALHGLEIQAAGEEAGAKGLWALARAAGLLRH